MAPSVRFAGQEAAMGNMRSALVLTLFAASFAAAPGTISSQGRKDVADPGAVGPHPIGHTSFLLTDTTRDAASPFRGRPIAVNVWYPADPGAIEADTREAVYALDPPYNRWPASTSTDWEQFGMERAYESVPVSGEAPFPLVLVSPGWNGRYYALFFYAERLASHGFVVAVAQHFHDGAYPWDTRDPMDLTLLNRPRDLSFMLDGMLARNGDPANLLFNSVRPDQVAASGHSFGGYAALVLAAGDDQVCGTLADPLPAACTPVGATLPDPRVKAIVPLDGSGWALQFRELARITVPSMAIGRPYETAELGGADQARQHAAISANPNYRVDIRGAVHPSFTNNCIFPRVLFAKGLIPPSQLQTALNAPQCTTAIDQRAANRLAAQYAVAFLKTQLAGEPGYEQMLTPGWALTRETDVEFFVTEPWNANALDDGTFLFFPHQPGRHTIKGAKDAVKAVLEGPIVR
jgi:predicted dienelactone hydrolase